MFKNTMDMNAEETVAAVANLTPWLERNIRKATQEDESDFLKWTSGLYGREGASGTGRYVDDTPIPFASGPHCVEAFRCALLAADDRLQSELSILEIGFNRGHSAAIMLGLNPAATVHSLDVVFHVEQQHGVNVLRQRFNHSFERFVFELRPELEKWLGAARTMPVHFDLVYIDGAHDYLSVVSDIELAERVGARWLLFDDYYSKWGPGVQPAIRACCLKVVGVFGNMALCRPGREYKTVQEGF